MNVLALVALALGVTLVVIAMRGSQLNVWNMLTTQHTGATPPGR